MTDMTLSDLSAELRMYAGRPEGIHVDNSAFAVWADAIDAHLAKAAQPVEAVDVQTALRFAADVIELYDDATTCDDYMISATDAADVVRVLAEQAALAHPRPAGDAHPDDLAVDAFASAMKEKLAAARTKGRGGWNTDDASNLGLSIALRNHVEKGDPRDVANFSMFLYQRGESILPATTGERSGEVVWPKKMQDRADGSHVYGGGYKAALKDASDHLAAQPRPVGVPWGYRLVPVEPTDDMCRNAREKIGIGSNVAHHVWHWMIAAAPDGEVG